MASARNGHSTEYLGDRLPPQNTDAEQWVLGAVMLDFSVFAKVKAILRGPEDFYRDAHATAYRAMLSLEAKGKPIDAITVHEELVLAGELTEVGGIEFVAELVNTVPGSTNAAYHAEIVRQHADSRAVIEAASVILNAGYSCEMSSADLIDLASREIAAVKQSSLIQAWDTPEYDVSAAPALFPLEVFPVGLRRLAEEVAASVPCPPDYFAVAALAVAGVAIGRSVALKVKPGWYEEANLWTGFVAPPGSGKSPALAVAKAPLIKIFEEQLRNHDIEIDAIRLRKACAKGAGGTLEIEAPAPLKQILYSETTMEALAIRLRDNPRGVIVVFDELSSLFSGMNQYKSGGGNDEQALLSLWSRTSFPINRKSQEGGIPIYVRSPNACYTGAIVPAKLKVIGTSKDGKRIDDGMLDRFLLSFPTEVAPDWIEQGIDPETEAVWEHAVCRLWSRPMVPVTGGYDRPYLVDWSPAAYDCYASWFRAHCAATQQSDFPQEMKGPHSKMRAYCARLALVLDQLGGAFGVGELVNPRPISVASVEGAIKLIAYFDAHYRRVLAFMSGSTPENSDARDVLAWIASRGKMQFTLRDLKKNFQRRFADCPEAIESVLAWLEEQGSVKRRPDPPRRSGGRPPGPSFEVNPSLLESAGKSGDRC